MHVAVDEAWRDVSTADIDAAERTLFGEEVRLVDGIDGCDLAVSDDDGLEAFEQFAGVRVDHLRVGQHKTGRSGRHPGLEDEFRQSVNTLVSQCRGS